MTYKRSHTAQFVWLRSPGRVQKSEGVAGEMQEHLRGVKVPLSKEPNLQMLRQGLAVSPGLFPAFIHMQLEYAPAPFPLPCEGKTRAEIICWWAESSFSIGETHYAGRDSGDNMADFISNPQWKCSVWVFMQPSNHIKSV